MNMVWLELNFYDILIKAKEIKLSAEYTYQRFNKWYFNLFGNGRSFRKEKEVI